MEGDLISQDWQIELQGLLMGPGTAYVVQRFNPWSAPTIRTATLERPRDHGLISAGADHLGQRLVTATFYMADSTDTAARQRLAAAWGPVSAPVALVWQEYGVKYRIVGKPALADSDVTPGMPTDCRFVATDPRIYTNAATTVSLSMPTASGGLGFPFGFPLAFGAGSSGLADFVNAGTFPTRPLVVFHGPLTGPSIENVTTGEKWRTTFDLPAGQDLYVDFDARTVSLTADGKTSRYSYTPSDAIWWELPAGTSQLRLGASAGTGTADVTARSAWI